MVRPIAWFEAEKICGPGAAADDSPARLFAHQCEPYDAAVTHPARVQVLNQDPVHRSGAYVLYWMQQSQRAGWNHALEYAAALANELGKPLLVGFGLTDDYPEANERHFAFMLEGLRDVAAELGGRGAGFVIRRGAPPDVAVSLAREAAAVVCDRGYLRHQRRWRDDVADRAGRRVVQVEGDVVVPVEIASGKQEYAARTLRPRLRRLVDEYLKAVVTVPLKVRYTPRAARGDIDPAEPGATLARLKIDRSVPRSPLFTGGRAAALNRLRTFVSQKLKTYAADRNDPAGGATSTLGPYLHFGHVSPVEVALALRAARGASEEDAAAFMEELVVRRELAVNFVHFRPDYDAYDAVPSWARQTLEKHRPDRRPHVYTAEQLEAAQIHDPYWNAAQAEMVLTGFMPNAMRMYWGKKVLEWTPDPRGAYETLLRLNNKYFLCGRDPNAYANVGWIFGLHDRPWGPERPVFGTVRYMNAAGLERKFDMDAYVQKVDRLRAEFAATAAGGDRSDPKRRRPKAPSSPRA